MLNESATTNPVTFDLDVVRVNGKRMTAAVFKQLYPGQPFNNEYDLLYELKGRVFQGKSFVLFTTPNGIRKFELTGYTSKTKALPLPLSLYRCLRGSQSLELDHFGRELRKYYTERSHTEDNTLDIEILYEILNNRRNWQDAERDQELLLGLLTEEFKARLQNEYEKGLKLEEKRNKLVETFINTPQVFIGA